MGDILPTDEQWKPAQVAAFMRISYQTARNQMFAGDFGPSHYAPKTRTLTVSANAVRRVKTERDAHIKSTRKTVRAAR